MSPGRSGHCASGRVRGHSCRPPALAACHLGARIATHSTWWRQREQVVGRHGHRDVAQFRPRSAGPVRVLPDRRRRRRSPAAAARRPRRARRCRPRPAAGRAPRGRRATAGRRVAVRRRRRRRSRRGRCARASSTALRSPSMPQTCAPAAASAPANSPTPQNRSKATSPGLGASPLITASVSTAGAAACACQKPSRATWKVRSPTVSATVVPLGPGATNSGVSPATASSSPSGTAGVGRRDGDARDRRCGSHPRAAGPGPPTGGRAARPVRRRRGGSASVRRQPSGAGCTSSTSPVKS